MKIKQTTVQRTFQVTHNGRNYVVDYINSDEHTMGLLNRDNWVIYDEKGEELQIYNLKNESKKKINLTKKNRVLTKKLVNYCISHFDDSKY